MSVRVISAVLDARIRPAARKLVAVVLASAARDDGTGIYPGEDRLVRGTSLSSSSVRRHVHDLRERDRVIVEVRRARFGVAHEHRFDLDRLRELEALRDERLEPLGDERRSAGRGAHPRAERRSSARGEALRDERPNVLKRPLASEVHTRDRSDRFDEFYSTYPRKVGRKAAVRAWEKALRDGADADEIVAGARRYSADSNLSTDRRYIPHPATWLNAGRWKTNPNPARRRSS